MNMNKFYKTFLFLFTIILLKFYITDAMVPCVTDIQCDFYCQRIVMDRVTRFRPMNVRGKCLDGHCTCIYEGL